MANADTDREIGALGDMLDVYHDTAITGQPAAIERTSTFSVLRNCNFLCLLLV